MLTMEEAVGQVRSFVETRLGTESAARKEIEDRLRQLEDSLGQYTKQLPKLAGGGPERDPDYKGVFPNEERARQFGLYVMATCHVNGDIRAKCAEKLAGAQLTFRSDKGQFVSVKDMAKALGESSDAAGGYMVPDELMRSIIRNVEQYGVIRARIRKVPMSSDRQSWPKRLTGFSVYYPDEGVAVTESAMTFGKVRLTAIKWGVYCLISRELEEDSAVALGELIALEFALAIAISEDVNGFQGDGTSTYGGITGVFESANVGSVVMSSGNTSFDDLTHDDFVDLKAAVPTYARKAPDCAWYMHPDIAAIAEKLKDGMGRPIYSPPTEARTARILGYPVVEAMGCPDSTDDAISTPFLAFGSLMLWGMMGIRRGLRVRRSDEIKLLEDQIAICGIARQTIQEADGDAIAVLSTAAA